VAAGSPAETAGLLIGDVLIGTGGALFVRPDSLMQALADRAPGDTLCLETVRGGRRIVITARVGTVESDEAQVEAA